MASRSVALVHEDLASARRAAPSHRQALAIVLAFRRWPLVEVKGGLYSGRVSRERDKEMCSHVMAGLVETERDLVVFYSLCEGKDRKNVVG